jgi:hypothetical protein
VLIDKLEIVRPRHEEKADGGGEVFPEEENNCLRQPKNLLQEQSLERQISLSIDSTGSQKFFLAT